jgi:hypothetical protein
MLTLSYHLGAHEAGAQGVGGRVVGDNLVVNGATLYQLVPGVGWEALPACPVVPAGIQWAFANGRGSLISVIDSGGNGWGRDGISNPWQDYGPAPASGPTPALHQSWGQVKARYQNTPGVTVTPGADNR